MMFYIWHTLIVLLFVAFSFFLGYKLCKSKIHRSFIRFLTQFDLKNHQVQANETHVRSMTEPDLEDKVLAARPEALSLGCEW
jgi:hypothetical protein